MFPNGPGTPLGRDSFFLKEEKEILANTATGRIIFLHHFGLFLHEFGFLVSVTGYNKQTGTLTPFHCFLFSSFH
jgi:hypothetical protein